MGLAARVAGSLTVLSACVMCTYISGTRMEMFQLDSSSEFFPDALSTNASFVAHPKSPALGSLRSPYDQRLADITAETVWINSLIKPVIPSKLWDSLPHFFQSWLRNYILGTVEYLGVGIIWSYYIYTCFGSDLFPEHNVPSWSNIFEQIKVASVSMPLFSLLPAITEHLCERGYAMTYGNVSDMGLPRYLLYLFVYMFFVEFGIYWVHRLLHDIPAGYKYLHKPHHKYNKDHTMSPFAGLAFHPIDGILQAIPHLFAIMLIPTHFFTHVLLLFAEGVWTANIHDNLDLKILPFMGAAWHTIHHTTYKHNYGHYFIFMDWFFGTLVSPAEHAAELRNIGKKPL